MSDSTNYPVLIDARHWLLCCCWPEIQPAAASIDDNECDMGLHQEAGSENLNIHQQLCHRPHQCAAAVPESAEPRPDQPVAFLC